MKEIIQQFEMKEGEILTFRGDNMILKKHGKSIIVNIRQFKSVEINKGMTSFNVELKTLVYDGSHIH